MGRIMIAMLHEGSRLGEEIASAWIAEVERAGPTLEDSVLWIDNPAVEAIKVLRPDLVVLVCDGPSPTFEQSVLQTCRAWQLKVLPIQGRASTVLFGPLEAPGEPGCVTCLQIRWEHSIRRTKLNLALAQKTGVVQPLKIALSLTHQERRVFATIVVEEIIRIVTERELRTKGHVCIYQRESVQWVSLVPSHGCARCNLLPDDHQSCGVLNFASRHMEDRSLLRIKTIDADELNRLYVHTDVGYVSSVHDLWTDEHYVRASAQIQVPLGRSHVGYGSGYSLQGAQQTAILEVIERMCAVECTNRKPVVRAAYADLNDVTINPRQFGVHDDAFYQSNGQYQFEPFGEDKPYSWVWGYSTMRSEPILIPEQVAHYGKTRDTTRFVKESSSGCALGNSLEEAVLHGLFEVLERDGFLNMWYGRLPVPELRLGSGCPEEVQRTMNVLLAKGYHVRLFDVSHDLLIPAILAVATGADGHIPSVACGSSCHLNPYEAASGALRELMVQVLHLEGISEHRRQEARAMFEDHTKIRGILDHVVVAALPEALTRWNFLLNTRHRPIQSIEAAYPDVMRHFHMHSDDIRMVLDSVLGDLHRRGFEVAVVKQTNVEAAYGGFEAVKVIIPGMTPITFGYGCQRMRGLSRVFELPYRMGYAQRALTAEELNEDCHPFA